MANWRCRADKADGCLHLGVLRQGNPTVKMRWRTRRGCRRPLPLFGCKLTIGHRPGSRVMRARVEEGGGKKRAERKRAEPQQEGVTVKRANASCVGPHADRLVPVPPQPSLLS
jgi:hypothetical protein